MILSKPIRKRDEQYLAWIRTLPCLSSANDVCVDIEAHHVPPKGGGKVGSKTDDSRTVPLCHRAHMEYHRVGGERFECAYGLILESEIARLNREYARLHPLSRTRTLKMKCVLHVIRCSECAQSHEIPLAKLSRQGAVLRFRCITKNQLVNVEVA